MSLQEVIDGYQSGQFVHLNNLLFRMQTYDQNIVSLKINDCHYSFIKVRVEEIEYKQLPALAIFLDNSTSNVESMMLQMSVNQGKIRNEYLESYTSTISHEFRTPLCSCLLFLETILSMALLEKQRYIIQMIYRQLNFLLSLVHDVLDLKLFELQGELIKKCEVFNPKSLFIFIMEMFYS